jgi:hypothetical protein
VYALHPAKPLIIPHIISMAITSKPGPPHKLLLDQGKLSITNVVNVYLKFALQKTHLRSLHFSFSTKRDTVLTFKSTAGPEKRCKQ